MHPFLYYLLKKKLNDKSCKLYLFERNERKLEMLMRVSRSIDNVEGL